MCIRDRSEPFALWAADPVPASAPCISTSAWPVPDVYKRQSMDNARNQDEIGDQELMVVSFGTSYNDNRRLTIGAIENAMEKAFPDYSVRRGFTSQIIIDHVKSRDNVKIDNVGEALKRAVDNEVKTRCV